MNEFITDDNGTLLAYRGVDECVRIPEYIKCIGDNAFINTNVKKVIIPKSVTNIRRYAFAGLHLEKVEIRYGCEYIGMEAFSNCTQLNEIVLPKTIQSTGSYVFKNCINLQKATINGIYKINTGLFAQCTNLREVSFNPFEIGCEAFYNTGLEKIIIPDNVRAIQIGAFKSCYNLKHVIIHNRIKFIGKRVFESCQLQYVRMPKRFYYCNKDIFEGADISNCKFEYV